MDVPRVSVPCGSTTFGEDIELHEDTIKKLVQTHKLQIRMIRKYLTNERKKIEDDPAMLAMKKRIMVVHFNYYCNDDCVKPDTLVPAEFALETFSINEGVLTNLEFVDLIDPVKTPLGMRSEMVEMAKGLGLPMIGRHSSVSADARKANDLMNSIDDWFNSVASTVESEKLLFAFPEEITAIGKCLKWLDSFRPIAERQRQQDKYTILPLTLLSVVLADIITKGKTERQYRIQNEAVAIRILSFPQYDFIASLGCKWHTKEENIDKIYKCSRNIALRRVYNLLQYFCRLCGIKKEAPCYEPILPVEDIVDREEMEYQKKRQYESMRYSDGEVSRIISHETITSSRRAELTTERELTLTHSSGYAQRNTSGSTPRNSPGTAQRNTSGSAQEGSPRLAQGDRRQQRNRIPNDMD